MTYKMISLLDRLKPEYSEELSKVNLKYPGIIASISSDLEEESVIQNLRYRTILDIKFVIGVDNPFVMFKDL
jgi:hypothetical protein